jgi:hypothetical protein
MIENENQAKVEEEQIEVSVEDDAVTSQDDELENYTKSVSKRINKLNAKTRAAEERAAMAEQIAQSREAEIHALRNHSQIQAGTVIQNQEAAIIAKEQQADDLYKQAVQSGDAGLMSRADTLKSDLSIQKEKVRLAKNRQQSEQAQQAQYQQAIQQQPAQQQPVVEPTPEALGWYEKNKWYGDAEDQGNLEATQYAYFQHYNLINEGHEPDSDEYYDELNNRVYKVYPHLQNANVGNQGEDEQGEAKPAVQRVASATVGSGRQKTQGRKNGVTFSKSEVERLRGLKPHNMSEDAWLKRVAAEKQKIASREAM